MVPEDTVEGRLGGYAVRYLGMQGIRPPPQAHQDMAPAGGVPQGLGEGIRLAPGRPFGGEDLPCGDALANQDTHPPGWRIPNAPPPPPPGLQGRPQKACHPQAPAWARITCCATAVRRVSDISTTSACHSATVLACATRIGPRWGSTSPQRSSRRGGKTRQYPTGTGGRAEPWRPQRGGREGGITHPTHVLSHQWSEGAKGGARGAAKHACRLISAPGFAAPWSGGRRWTPA